MTKLELDPATQKIVDDFNTHAKKRFTELLGHRENAHLQAIAETAFSLGYKAGAIDLGAVQRELEVVDVGQLAVVFAAACAWRDSAHPSDVLTRARSIDTREERLIAAVDAARKERKMQQPLSRDNPWAVSVRYAAPESRPKSRRHPVPEDFCRRTVVGPAGKETVEMVLDLLEVPEDVRARIRAKDVVRDFVEGKLVPDQAYPHNTTGMHYVSAEPDAQLVEWSIEFMFVTQVLS